LAQRLASETEVNAAFLSGTDITGGAEGVGGQDRGQYNGGLENYPRFHEAWQWGPSNNRTYVTFTYRESFVSLGSSRKAAGRWCYGTGNCNGYDHFYGTYEAPRHQWSWSSRDFCGFFSRGPKRVHVQVTPDSPVLTVFP
jgi:hypothetical protein